MSAAVDLFERNGYEKTTVADIAAAAEIGTRTFFSYFASKEELLFPSSDARVRATVDAIASRRPDEGPAEVLVRALAEAAATDDDLTGPMAALRIKLMREVPTVLGRGLQIQLDAQREIGRHLAAAYPDELDEVSGAALAGALIGAVSTALVVLFDDPSGVPSPSAVRSAVRRATSLALRPWSRPQPFATSSLSDAMVVTAPDGSVVRPLAAVRGAGSFAHFSLGAGEVSRAVVHATVHEIWYVVAGEGEMWRSSSSSPAGIVALRPGVCLTIPVGTAFQFRAGAVGLEVVAVTMPPWPEEADGEARPASGPWEPSV